MKLYILGTSAAFPSREEGCSAYMIESDEKYYLIDVGSGAVGMMSRFIHYTRLSGIFISHLHADHSSDILPLRYAIYTAQKDEKIPFSFPVYMPRKPSKYFRFIKNFIKGECSIYHPSNKNKIEIEKLHVSFLKVEHPIPTYGMRFEEDGRSLVYTSDTMFFDELVRFSKGADVILAEATLQNIDRNLVKLGHMTAEDAGVLASEAGAKTLILTHIWPEYDRAVTLKEAGSSFSGELFIAKGGDIYTI